MNTTNLFKARLASHLFSLRSEQGLSLDSLAQKSGVSRATLSRIENADVSPTADTLAALSAAFGISLSKLMAMTEEGFAAHIPLEDQTEWEEPDTGTITRAVSPPTAQLAASVIELHLPPHTQHQPASTPGAEAHLIMLDGAVSVRIGNVTHALTAGDCLRVKDSAMSFATPEHRGARFLQISV